VAEQYHRHTDLPTFDDEIFDVVEEGGEPVDVSSTPAALTEAPVVERHHIVASTGEETAGLLIAARVLPEAVNEHDS
jgi:hypothetical protein